MYGVDEGASVGRASAPPQDLLDEGDNIEEKLKSKATNQTKPTKEPQTNKQTNKQTKTIVHENG